MNAVDAAREADIASRTRPRATRPLRVGGLVPFSTIDMPDQMAAVVFVSGCPWRCGYCHNPHLQRRDRESSGPGWPQVLRWLRGRAGLLDGVVFSGGEPTVDPALPHALAAVRGLGMKTGLHTAGTHPRRLRAVLPWIDWVGLDVKAPLDDAAAYAAITGTPGAAAAARRSLERVLDSGVAAECRTTIHPRHHDDDTLVRLATSLAANGVRHYALQVVRRAGDTASGLEAVPAGYPAPCTLERVARMFERFVFRAA